LPEVIYGLSPDMGGTQTLTSLVGRARAKYLIMSGDSISAEQAHQWGIADWLVDDADVDTQALAIAKKIAAQSPQSVMMVKRLVDQVEIADIKQGLQQELTSITTLFKSDDYAEARQALIDKRKPTFTGK
jgi:enoyl-CoA hydratase/carnithine racemase